MVRGDRFLSKLNLGVCIESAIDTLVGACDRVGTSADQSPVQRRAGQGERGQDGAGLARPARLYPGLEGPPRWARRGWIVSPRLSISTSSAILAARFSGVLAC